MAVNQPGRDPAADAMEDAVDNFTWEVANLVGALEEYTARLELAQRQEARGGDDAPRRRDRADGLGGAAAKGVGGLLVSLSAKLFAFLAPVVALTSVLGEATSGMSTFFRAANLVTTTISGMFLPGFILLSGVAFALAGVIQEQVMPAFWELASDVFPLLFDAVREAVQALADFVKFLKKADEESGGALRGGAEEANLTNSKWNIIPAVMGVNFLRGALRGRQTVGESSGDHDRRPTQPGDPFREGTGASAGGGFFGGQEVRTEETGVDRFMKDVERGMKLAMASLEKSLNPRAESSGLVDAYKKAQMAALNADPLAQEQLKVQRQTLERMTGLLNEFRTKFKPPVTR